MKKVQPVTTFRTAAVGRRFVICLSGAMDAFEPNEPYSRMYFLNQNAPNLWTFSEHDFLVPSVCVWQAPGETRRIFVALSENGQVAFLAPNQPTEKIREAGLNPGLGYLNDIQQIGGKLYACGFSGQVYRRDGADNWVHMDDGLLQRQSEDNAKYFIQAINGTSENSIFVAGSEMSAGHPARADHWNGEEWRRLELPPWTGRITTIFVESEEKVWMCGARGTVLCGNAREGFIRLNGIDENHLILSICTFNKMMYLASNLGLFSFDPANTAGGLTRVSTGMTPELQDTNVVESTDDVLWSIGPKDIARFDGNKWERFHHPDNARIE